MPLLGSLRHAGSAEVREKGGVEPGMDRRDTGICRFYPGLDW
jgi:hypothetical protein